VASAGLERGSGAIAVERLGCLTLGIPRGGRGATRLLNSFSTPLRNGADSADAQPSPKRMAQHATTTYFNEPAPLIEASLKCASILSI